MQIAVLASFPTRAGSRRAVESIRQRYPDLPVSLRAPANPLQALALGLDLEQSPAPGDQSLTKRARTAPVSDPETSGSLTNLDDVRGAIVVYVEADELSADAVFNDLLHLGADNAAIMTDPDP